MTLFFVFMYLWAGLTLTASQWLTIRNLQRSRHTMFPALWGKALLFNLFFWPAFPFYILSRSQENN